MPKVTSEQLLKLFGLKVGDKIEINLQMYGYTTLKLENRNSGLVWYDENTDTIYKFVYILDKDFEIIKPKPKLSEDEKVILRNLPKEYKWIARDETIDNEARLFIYGSFPERATTRGIKYECWVDYCTGSITLRLPHTHLFKFITWEDEEPYNIKELLDE